MIGKEAVIVGILNVPIWLISQHIVDSLKIPEKQRGVLTAVLSGMSFHLLAEYSGMNAWYIENGHAALDQKEKYREKKRKDVVCSDSDRRAGLCSLSLSSCQKRGSCK